MGKEKNEDYKSTSETHESKSAELRTRKNRTVNTHENNEYSIEVEKRERGELNTFDFLEGTHVRETRRERESSVC